MDPWCHVEMFCPDAYQSSSLSLSFCVCTFAYVWLSCPHTQDEEAIPVELRNLPEYKELLELKRLKKQTLQEIQEDRAGMLHVGYKVKSLHTVQHTTLHYNKPYTYNYI